MKSYKCKQCGLTFLGRSELIMHKVAEHNFVPKGRNSSKLLTLEQALTKSSNHSTPAMQEFNSLRLSLSIKLKRLEEERDSLSRKLLEYDDLISKYKKLL